MIVVIFIQVISGNVCTNNIDTINLLMWRYTMNYCKLEKSAFRLISKCNYLISNERRFSNLSHKSNYYYTRNTFKRTVSVYDSHQWYIQCCSNLWYKFIKWVLVVNDEVISRNRPTFVELQHLSSFYHFTGNTKWCRSSYIYSISKVLVNLKS